MNKIPIHLPVSSTGFALIDHRPRHHPLKQIQNYLFLKVMLPLLISDHLELGEIKWPTIFPLAIRDRTFFGQTAQVMALTA